jgi:hypothetical protein
LVKNDSKVHVLPVEYEALEDHVCLDASVSFGQPPAF